MEIPKPTEHHEKLAAMAGNWQGEETLHPSPFGPGGTAVGRFTNRTDLGGFVLIQDYAQTRDGAECFHGHGVYGFDAASGDYLMFWSDTMGGMPTEIVRGRWEGNVLTFAASCEHGHSRYVYTLHDDGSFGFSLHMSQDGENWAPYMEGRYTRQG